VPWIALYHSQNHSIFSTREMPPQVEPLSLPPEGEWPTLAALIEAAQEHARLAGYAIVKGPGGEQRIDKGGR
jgi:hypothetical protein